MQNIDHTNLNVIELTDSELDAINGGNWIGDAARAVGGAIVKAAKFVAGGLQGPGDTRGPTHS
jgi:bacteriocin-like protein